MGSLWLCMFQGRLRITTSFATSGDMGTPEPQSHLESLVKRGPVGEETEFVTQTAPHWERVNCPETGVSLPPLGFDRNGVRVATQCSIKFTSKPDVPAVPQNPSSGDKPFTGPPSRGTPSRVVYVLDEGLCKRLAKEPLRAYS